MTRRTIIIGDIHGMRAELEQLLELVRFDRTTDRLVTTGDIVHKGPDSAGVVRVLREAGAENALGNHDEKQARFRKALAAVGGIESKLKMKGIEEMSAIGDDLVPEDTEYMESAKLFVRVPGGVVVHAGILDDIEAIPTDEELAELSKGERKKLERVLRVRHVRGTPETKLTIEVVLNSIPEVEVGTIPLGDFTSLSGGVTTVVRKSVRPVGAFLSLGKEGPDDPYWADVYDGRFGTVYFGHQPFIKEKKPVTFPHAVGLDTGAVFGGYLTAIVLGEDGGVLGSYSVEASKKFATSLWED